MKSVLLVFIILTSSFVLATAQVGINPDNSDPDPSAMLDVSSTEKGMLIPRMTTVQREAISSPATGLLVFDESRNSFFYFDGFGWAELVSGFSTTIADSDGDTKIQTEKNFDENIIRFDVAGTEVLNVQQNSNTVSRVELPNTAENTIAIGIASGASLETGGKDNTFFGDSTGYHTTNTDRNTFIGATAGFSNTGYNNTFVGNNAGYANTSGDDNTFIGEDAGKSTITGFANTFLGQDAGDGNTTGNENVYIGESAGSANETGSGNIFIGASAGSQETNASDRLYIENSRSTSPLLYGEFDNDIVEINGQLGVNSSPDASAMLDVNSTEKGILIPRMTTTQREAISSPATGLLVFDNNENAFWYYADTAWIEINTNSTFKELAATSDFELLNSGELAVIGFASTSTSPTAVAGNSNYAFVLDNVNDELEVFNISNPAAPASIGTTTSGTFTNPTALAVSGNYVFVADGSRQEVVVIDVNTPAMPTEIGSVNLGGFVRAVIVDGDYAYAYENTGKKIHVIDITTPTAPVSVGNVTVGVGINNLSKTGNYVYGSDNSSGDVHAIDVSTPASPVAVDSEFDEFYLDDIAAYGNYVYAFSDGANQLSVFDATTPAALNEVLEISIADPVSATVSDDYLYVARGSNADIVLFELSNPANPQSVDTLSLSANPTDIRCSDDYCFVVSDAGDILEIIKNGQTLSNLYLAIDESGSLSAIAGTNNVTASDDLGDHTATQNINLNGNWLSGDGDNEGVYISADGNVGIGRNDPDVALDVQGDIEYTGTITDVSDRRLKENLLPVSNTLSALSKLQAYTYTMKSDSTRTREYGLIAQDVQQVFPEMVKTIDAEGEHLGLSYIQLIPVLVEAMKELKTENEQLRAENKDLADRISKIEELKDMLLQLQAQLSMTPNATDSTK